MRYLLSLFILLPSISVYSQNRSVDEMTPDEQVKYYADIVRNVSMETSGKLKFQLERASYYGGVVTPEYLVKEYDKGLQKVIKYEKKYKEAVEKSGKDYDIETSYVHKHVGDYSRARLNYILGQSYSDNAKLNILIDTKVNQKKSSPEHEKEYEKAYKEEVERLTKMFKHYKFTDQKIADSFEMKQLNHHRDTFYKNLKNYRENIELNAIHSKYQTSIDKNKIKNDDFAYKPIYQCVFGLYQLGLVPASAFCIVPKADGNFNIVIANTTHDSVYDGLSSSYAMLSNTKVSSVKFDKKKINNCKGFSSHIANKGKVNGKKENLKYNYINHTDEEFLENLSKYTQAAIDENEGIFKNPVSSLGAFVQDDKGKVYDKQDHLNNMVNIMTNDFLGGDEVDAKVILKKAKGKSNFAKVEAGDKFDLNLPKEMNGKLLDIGFKQTQIDKELKKFYEDYLFAENVSSNVSWDKSMLWWESKKGCGKKKAFDNQKNCISKERFKRALKGYLLNSDSFIKHYYIGETDHKTEPKGSYSELVSNLKQTCNEFDPMITKKIAQKVNKNSETQVTKISEAYNSVTNE
jgi:hypothetical protein